MATLDDYIRVAQLIKRVKEANPTREQWDAAANVRNLGSGSQQSSGGGGSSSVSAAPSYLSTIPHTPLMDDLIAKGLLNDSMTQQQVQAIIGIQGLKGNVPIDLKAIMDQLRTDYASSTGDILNSGADWMQQLYGTNYDPNDPNAALFAQDPIFSSYAGGLAQLQSTAGLNEANDLAWFDKEQASEQAYYDMLTQMMSDPAALGTSSGGSGGGGGGGGGYGGSGGSGSSDGEDTSPGGIFPAPITTVSARLDDYVKSYINNRQDNPNFIPTIQDYLHLAYPDQEEAVMDILKIEGNLDPNASLAALAEARTGLETGIVEGTSKNVNNLVWTQAQPGFASGAVSDYLTNNMLTVGDDPSTVYDPADPTGTLEYFYSIPEDQQTQQMLDQYVLDQSVIGEHPEQNAWNQAIFDAMYNPEGYTYDNPYMPDELKQLISSNAIRYSPTAYPGTDNPGGLEGLIQQGQEREAGRQRIAHNATIPGYLEQVAEYTRPVPTVQNGVPAPASPNNPDGVDYMDQDSVDNYILPVIEDLAVNQNNPQLAADWLEKLRMVIPQELMPQINSWIEDNAPEMFYSRNSGTSNTNISPDQELGPFEGNPDLFLDWETPPLPQEQFQQLQDLAQKMMVRKRPTMPNPFLFGNNGTPITPQSMVTEYGANAITPEGGIRQNVMDTLMNVSREMRRAASTSSNGTYYDFPAEYYDETAPSPQELTDMQDLLTAIRATEPFAEAASPAYGMVTESERDVTQHGESQSIASTDKTKDALMAEFSGLGDPDIHSISDYSSLLVPTGLDETQGEVDTNIASDGSYIGGGVGSSVGGNLGGLTNSLINNVIRQLAQPQPQTTVANPYHKTAVAGNVSRNMNLPQVALPDLKKAAVSRVKAFGSPKLPQINKKR